MGLGQRALGKLTSTLWEVVWSAFYPWVSREEFLALVERGRVCVYVSLSLSLSLSRGFKLTIIAHLTLAVSPLAQPDSRLHSLPSNCWQFLATSGTPR